MTPRASFAALVPCGGPGQEPCQIIHLFHMVISIYNTLISSAALVALAFIVVGGIRMFIWSIMEDAPTELTAAKRTVGRAIAGLLIVLLSYVIANTVVMLFTGSELNSWTSTIFS